MKENKGNIVYGVSNAEYGQKNQYFDKYGDELKEGDLVKFDDGRIRKLYLSDDGNLGTDATSHHWVFTKRALPCEYGIYPLDWEDVTHCYKLQLRYTQHLPNEVGTQPRAISYDKALELILNCYVDTDISHDWLLRANHITLNESWIEVIEYNPETDSWMYLMPGYENFVPEGWKYDKETGERITG